MSLRWYLNYLAETTDDREKTLKNNLTSCCFQDAGKSLSPTSSTLARRRQVPRYACAVDMSRNPTASSSCKSRRFISSLFRSKYPKPILSSNAYYTMEWHGKSKLNKTIVTAKLTEVLKRELPERQFYSMEHSVVAGCLVGIDRSHMTSRRPYWCTKTMKRRPCWCTKPILWELSSFLM